MSKFGKGGQEERWAVVGLGAPRAIAKIELNVRTPFSNFPAGVRFWLALIGSAVDCATATAAKRHTRADRDEERKAMGYPALPQELEHYGTRCVERP